jgi:hypothetical protein
VIDHDDPYSVRAAALRIIAAELSGAPYMHDATREWLNEKPWMAPEVVACLANIAAGALIELNNGVRSEALDFVDQELADAIELAEL